QRPEVPVRRSFAGKTHHHVLNIEARLLELIERDRSEMQQVLQHLRQAARVPLADECPTLYALLELHDARDLEAAQGLAKRAAADTQLLREIALGRKLVPRLENPGRKTITDALANLLECAARPDRVKNERSLRRV